MHSRIAVALARQHHPCPTALFYPILKENLYNATDTESFLQTDVMNWAIWCRSVTDARRDIPPVVHASLSKPRCQDNRVNGFTSIFNPFVSMNCEIISNYTPEGRKRGYSLSNWYWNKEKNVITKYSYVDSLPREPELVEFPQAGRLPWWSQPLIFSLGMDD